MVGEERIDRDPGDRRVALRERDASAVRRSQNP
jgi:hypothetical protein